MLKTPLSHGAAGLSPGLALEPGFDPVLYSDSSSAYRRMIRQMVSAMLMIMTTFTVHRHSCGAYAGRGSETVRSQLGLSGGVTPLSHAGCTSGPRDPVGDLLARKACGSRRDQRASARRSRPKITNESVDLEGLTRQYKPAPC